MKLELRNSQNSVKANMRVSESLNLTLIFTSLISNPALFTVAAAAAEAAAVLVEDELEFELFVLFDGCENLEYFDLSNNSIQYSIGCQLNASGHNKNDG
jgi:hypothetical protein